jgi:hypothetical protein
MHGRQAARDLGQAAGVDELAVRWKVGGNDALVRAGLDEVHHARQDEERAEELPHKSESSREAKSYTVGKYALGLRVIKPDGQAPSANSIAARNVIRILEEPLLALLVMIGSGARRQRIGDFVGTTAVGSVVYSNPPQPSRLRVIYPALWLAGALLLGLVLNASAGYLDDVNRICVEETSRLGAVERTQFKPVLRAYAEMERRIALLDPPTGEGGRHRSILGLMHQVNGAGASLHRQTRGDPADVPEFRAAYARYREIVIPLQQQLIALGVTCRSR